MGKPKALIEVGGRPMAETVAAVLTESVQEPVLLGQGPLPASLTNHISLPDPPDLEGAGPLAGLLSAMRWDPLAAWVLCGVDMPTVSVDAVQWVLGHRAPGIWAVLPRLPGKSGVEPLLAFYEPMAALFIEAMAQAGELRLQKLADHPRVLTPDVPAPLVRGFRNINTPEDLSSGPRGRRDD